MKKKRSHFRLPEASDADPSPVAPLVDTKAQAGGNRVRLLVSACLLGEQARYDGQHKYDAYLVESLGRFVDWVRVCPESDSGMPTPRPSMHPVGDPRACYPLVMKTSDRPVHSTIGFHQMPKSKSAAVNVPSMI